MSAVRGTSSRGESWTQEMTCARRGSAVKEPKHKGQYVYGSYICQQSDALQVMAQLHTSIIKSVTKVD